MLGLLAWQVPDIADMKIAQDCIDWPRHYAALVEYGKEYGHCNVPRKNIAHDYYKCVLKGIGENGSDFQYHGNLGTWLFTQRQRKRLSHSC